MDNGKYLYHLPVFQLSEFDKKEGDNNFKREQSYVHSDTPDLHLFNNIVNEDNYAIVNQER